MPIHSDMTSPVETVSLAQFEQPCGRAAEHVVLNLCIEGQGSNRLDILANAVGALADPGIVIVEVLRIVGGKDHLFGPDTLQCAAQRDGAALKSGHVEIEKIEILREILRQLEAMRRAR